MIDFLRGLLIRDRITLTSIAILAVGLAALSIATDLLITQQLTRDAQSILEERTRSQLSTLVLRDDRLEPRRVDDSTLDRQSWAFSKGAAIERPPAPNDLQAAADALAGVNKTTERTIGESARLRATPVFGDNGRRLGTVVVATSLEPYEHSERIARIALIALSLIVLLFGAIVARRAVSTALRPVGLMAARAADWSEHHPERRMSLGPPRDELTGLAATLDELLGRIDAALRHEQRFSAEVAHEMRTPLTGMRAEAELAMRNPSLDRRTRDSLEAILASADRMSSAIDTLLLSARAPGARGATDSAAPIDEIVSAFEPAAKAAGVAIEIRPSSTAIRIGADHEQVAQALAPLLDNAIGHAAARVVVSSSASGGIATLAVEDDGAGLPSGGDRDIFGPGVSSRGGAGLGLPLARRLARACGGDVVVVDVGSGARFELRLPGAVSPR
jgi:two-component system, OmpR family, sensor kinase